MGKRSPEAHIMTKKSAFDDMIADLQQQIDQQEDENFSPTVLKEYRHPSNFCLMEDPDAVGKIKGPCGDTMMIMLKIHQQKITKICFWTDGCGTSVACGSMLTKLIKGQSIEDVAKIKSEDLNRALDGLPDTHVHCTLLAVNTLKKALQSLENSQ